LCVAGVGTKENVKGILLKGSKLSDIRRCKGKIVSVHVMKLGVYGDCKFGFIHSYARDSIELSGHSHPLVTLLLGTESPISIEYEA
jgi:hypothetical protein